MSWDAPERDIRTVHPDWLDPVAARFGGCALWDDMTEDEALRPDLLHHLQFAIFGEPAPRPARPPQAAAQITRALGPDGETALPVAGWFWFAPVLLPRLISGGAVAGLTTPGLPVFRAMREWAARDDVPELQVPGSDVQVAAAGAACRLAWISGHDDGLAQRALLQLPRPEDHQRAIAADPSAGGAFAAALSLGAAQ